MCGVASAFVRDARQVSRGASSSGTGTDAARRDTTQHGSAQLGCPMARARLHHTMIQQEHQASPEVSVT